MAHVKVLKKMLKECRQTRETKLQMIIKKLMKTNFQLLNFQVIREWLVRGSEFWSMVLSPVVPFVSPRSIFTDCRCTGWFVDLWSTVLLIFQTYSNFSLWTTSVGHLSMDGFAGLTCGSASETDFVEFLQQFIIPLVF